MGVRQLARLQKTCFPCYSGKKTFFKPCYYCSPGHRATNKPAGWVHVPYARGQSVCQPEDRLPGLPELHPTDTRGPVWPGSQYCSVCSLCLEFRPAKPCFLEPSCAILQTSQIIKKICKQCRIMQFVNSFTVCSQLFLSSGGWRLAQHDALQSITGLTHTGIYTI